MALPAFGGRNLRGNGCLLDRNIAGVDDSMCVFSSSFSKASKPLSHNSEIMLPLFDSHLEESIVPLGWQLYLVLFFIVAAFLYLKEKLRQKVFSILSSNHTVSPPPMFLERNK